MTHRLFNIAAAAALVALILTVPTFAQNTRLVITVNHDFTVGSQTLPAGKYTIRRATRNNTRIFVIENVDSRRATVHGAIPQSEDETSAENVVTFTRYGDEYFLTSVQTAGNSKVFKFNTSSREQTLLARTELQPELIEIRASRGR